MLSRLARWQTSLSPPTHFSCLGVSDDSIFVSGCLGNCPLRRGLGRHIPRYRAGGWARRRPGARESCRGGLGSGPVGAVVRETNPGPGGARPGPFDGDGRAGRLGVLDEVVVGRPDQPIAVIAVTGGVVGKPGGASPDPGGWPLGPAGAEPASPRASGDIGLRSLLVHVRRLLSALLGNVGDDGAAAAETVRSRSWSTGRHWFGGPHSCMAGPGLEPGARGRCFELWPPGDKAACGPRFAASSGRMVLSRCWSWPPRRPGPRFLRG